MSTPTWAHYLAEDIAAAHSTIEAYLFAAVWPPSTTKFRRRGTYDDVIAALRAAAKRGVAITITTAGPTSRIPSTAKAVWMAERMAADGIGVTLLRSPPLLHAKVWIIDRTISWLGSANLTPRACERNIELMMRTQHQTTADVLPQLLRAAPADHGKSH